MDNSERLTGWHNDPEQPEIEESPVTLRDHPVFQERINDPSWICEAFTEKVDMGALMVAFDDNDLEDIGRLVVQAIEDHCGDDLEDAK